MSVAKSAWAITWCRREKVRLVELRWRHIHKGCEIIYLCPSAWIPASPPRIEPGLRLGHDQSAGDMGTGDAATADQDFDFTMTDNLKLNLAFDTRQLAVAEHV